MEEHKVEGKRSRPEAPLVEGMATVTPGEDMYRYDPLDSDPLDEQFANMINAAALRFPVIRLGGNYYLFGTVKIHARIVVNNIVVRIGSNVLELEEFIE